MQHDAWFFIGILVFIFLIWAASGGPVHPLSFAGPSLAQPGELGGGTYLQLPRAPFGIGDGTTVSLPGSSGGVGISGQPTGFFGIALGSASPLGGTVRLAHYVSNASSTDPANEYLELSVDRNASGPIGITNWLLRSETTERIGVVPRGTTVPAAGVVNATEPIVLNPGDHAYIHSGKSPIGLSFRENKCTGYFEDAQDFSPPLSLSCPAADDELERVLGRIYLRDPSCVDYVNTLSSCQVPRRAPSTLTQRCQNFLIDHLHYNACVAAHKNDPDFHGTTWHIYLGRDKYPLWRVRHEFIKLLDAEGRTVDAFTY